MDIEELREYCLSIKEATEDMPFEDEYLIFRVFGKWFAVIPLKDTELKISVKCDPARAIDLRERYACVESAWHFNKKYWNSIVLNRDMDDQTVKYWIRHSVEEVVKKLPKKMQLSFTTGSDAKFEKITCDDITTTIVKNDDGTTTFGIIK